VSRLDFTGRAGGGETLKPELFDRVRQIAADIFSTPADRMTRQSSPEEIEKWDSVQHLSLVLALEQGFNVQFDPEEMDQMKTLGDITDLVDLKLSRDS
jgi:acyl carrier protein